MRWCEFGRERASKFFTRGWKFAGAASVRARDLAATGINSAGLDGAIHFAVADFCERLTC
jgi:hypothetical protein